VFQKVISIVSLVMMFEKDLSNLAIHVFRAIHQYRQIRLLKMTLSDNDCLLHIDYSENYPSKLYAEVQAAHFGNRHQIVIHQGLVYLKVCYHYFLFFVWSLHCEHFRRVKNLYHLLQSQMMSEKRQMPSLPTFILY
jgi:hypothetical protein